jgi:hypothetical protein
LSLGGAAFGFFSALATELVRDHRSARREKDAFQRELGAKVLTARDEFQRATLLEMQAALNDLVLHVTRATGAIATDLLNREQDLEEHWNVYCAPEESADASTVAMRVAVLRVRILDEAVRHLVEDAEVKYGRWASALSSNDAYRSLLDLRVDALRANEGIGALLRGYF